MLPIFNRKLFLIPVDNFVAAGSHETISQHGRFLGIDAATFLDWLKTQLLGMDLHMVVCFWVFVVSFLVFLCVLKLFAVLLLPFWRKESQAKKWHGTNWCAEKHGLSCHLTFRSLQKASTVLHGVTRISPIFSGRRAAIKGRWYHENSIQIHKQKQIDQMDSNGFVMIHLSAVHLWNHSLAGEGDCRRRQNQKWRFSDEHTHTRKSRRRVVETCFLSGTSHQLDSKEG